MADILQNTKLMFFIFLAIGAVVLVIVLELLKHSRRRNIYRSYKKSIMAEIVTLDKGVRFDNSGEDRKVSEHAEYVFKVDGKEYKGRGEIGTVGVSQKIKVWYDPQDPNNNCTNFCKKQSKGSHVILGFLAVIAFFVVLFVVLKIFA